MAEQAKQRRGYAVGVQMFDWIRERGSVYVDKTEYVWKMVSTDAVNFFLSRPQRFGKSLLVDTLRCYFEGRKELFEGLYIYNKEQEWKKYPVVRLDLSNGKYYEKERVHGTLSGILRDHEKRWNVTVYDEFNYDDRLKNIILQQLTFDQAYEGICGITEQELLTYMKPDIELLTERMDRTYSRWRLHYTYDDVVAKLKDTIDSYRIVQVK